MGKDKKKPNDFTYYHGSIKFIYSPILGLFFYARNDDYYYSLVPYFDILKIKNSERFYKIFSSGIKEPDWFLMKDEFNIIKFDNHILKFKKNLLDVLY